MKHYLFFKSGKDIGYGGLRPGSFDTLSKSFPNAAIVEQMPENWREMSVVNGELVPSTEDEIEFRNSEKPEEL